MPRVGLLCDNAHTVTTLAKYRVRVVGALRPTLWHFWPEHVKTWITSMKGNKVCDKIAERSFFDGAVSCASPIARCDGDRFGVGLSLVLHLPVRAVLTEQSFIKFVEEDALDTRECGTCDKLIVDQHEEVNFTFRQGLAQRVEELV